MIKNSGAKGGKGRKKAKRTDITTSKRELVIANNGENQQYARISSVLGNCRFMSASLGGENILTHCPGKFQKGSKVWINKNDIVLISIRDFESKADIICKYYPSEVKSLIQLKEIPLSFCSGEKIVNEEEKYFTFEEEDDTYFQQEKKDTYFEQEPSEEIYDLNDL